MLETFGHRGGRTRFQSSDCGLLIADAAAQLASAGIENERLDAEVMLAAACGCPRAAIVCGLAEIDSAACERYAAMIARRLQREPLAYILGHKEFYSLEFEATPAVLIPRPETETVVAAALEFTGTNPDARICDLGTGSGAIALAIAANAPDSQITATDISRQALAIARRNADRLELAARLQFRLADVFDPIGTIEPLGRFDLIVSNPPYVREDEVVTLAPEISRYEPRLALAGGRDGLEFYRRMAARLTQHLQKNGRVIVEFGTNEADAVIAVMRDAGALSARVICDLADLPRVVVAQFR